MTVAILVCARPVTGRVSRTWKSGAGTPEVTTARREHRNAGDRIGRPPETGGIPMMTTTEQSIRRQRPVLMRVLVWAPRDYRRPRLRAVLRLACAILSLAAAGELLSAGPQVGSLALLGLLPLAASGVLLWTAYRLMLVADARQEAAGRAGGKRAPGRPLRS
jgi:hypothetical protein